MRASLAVVLTLLAVLTSLPFPAGAETPARDAKVSAPKPAGSGAATQSGLGEDPDDPSNLLLVIQERNHKHLF